MALTKISTPGIKDEAITLAKLLHGDSNNNGKFLKANNGADPTFETIDLTALSASNLTSGTIPDARFPATLPAVSAANLTNIPAANITGALPAIDGSNLTGVTSTTINNNANNKLITGSGTANTLEAESSATYDGTKLALTGGSGSDGHINMLELKHLNTASSAGNGDGPALLLNGYYANNEWAMAKIAAVNVGGGYGGGYGGGLQFWVHPANGTQTASVIKAAEIIGNNGGADLYITNGDVKFASGHGIDFSATGNAGNSASMSDELFDDYETGTWTPFFYAWIGGGSPATHDTQIGRYTKVGNLVHITYDLKGDRGNMAHNYITVGGLPFTYSSSNKGWAAIPWTEYVGSENSTSATRGHGLQFGGGATAHAWLTGYTNTSNYLPVYLSTSYMSNGSHTRLRGSATYFTNQ